MIYKNINLEWLGHSGFKITGGNNLTIYIDPFKLSGKESDEEDYEENEKADFIFITHSHYDHCSIEDIKKITKDGTTIIAPADVSSKLKHINQKINIVISDSLESEGKELIEENLKFWSVPAYNLKKSFHAKEEDWVGYILDIKGTIIYHAGDTDLIPEMSKLKAIGIDIAILPIGGTYTMNAGEAAKAAGIIKPKIAIPMHFGMLDKTGSKSDADIFLKLCSAENIDARVL